jgi:hypothetical protein
LRGELALATGSQRVGFAQAGGGRTVTAEAKMRQVLAVEDYPGYDATGLTPSDGALALCMAEAQLRGRCEVILPRYAKYAAGHSVPSGVYLAGPRSRAIMEWGPGNYIGLSFPGNDTGASGIEHRSVAKTGGADARRVCGTAQVDRFFYSDVISYDSFGILDDNGTGGGVHATTIVSDVQAKRLRGHGVNMIRGKAFIWYIRVTPDYVGQGASNFKGFRWRGAGLGGDAGGVNMIDCHTLGTEGVFSNPDQGHLDIEDMSAVWIHNSMGDTVCGDAWRFKNVNGLHVLGMISSLMNGHAATFENVRGTIYGFEAYGRNYLAGANAGKDGIRLIAGCAALKFIAPQVESMTGRAFAQIAAQAGAVSVSDPSFFNNTGAALFARGASPLNTGLGQLAGNGSQADIDNVLHKISNMQGHGGGLLNQSGPWVG